MPDVIAVNELQIKTTKSQFDALLNANQISLRKLQKKVEHLVRLFIII